MQLDRNREQERHLRENRMLRGMQTGSKLKPKTQGNNYRHQRTATEENERSQRSRMEFRVN